MPRPTCPRKITCTPRARYFKPAGIPLRQLGEVLLAPDELEAVRLADCEELYRADAAERMGISRQTFDRNIRRARKKVATALLKGLALRIEKPARRSAN